MSTAIRRFSSGEAQGAGRYKAWMSEAAKIPERVWDVLSAGAMERSSAAQPGRLKSHGDVPIRKRETAQKRSGSGRRRSGVKVTTFATRVAMEEGQKKSISIAQILEVLRIVNKLLGGALYQAIRRLK